MANEPAGADSIEPQMRETPKGDAGKPVDDVVVYWDDGEWHAQVVSDGPEVIAAVGGNRQEALDALYRPLGRD
jgi:hypothetical protein